MNPSVRPCEGKGEQNFSVIAYNTKRPHQSLGDRPPAERFAPAPPRVPVHTTVEISEVAELMTSSRPPGVSQWVDQRGSIGLDNVRYRVGPTFAGEAVEVVVGNGLVEILHKASPSPPTPSADDLEPRH